jgi:hypothetical protein
VLRPNAKVAPPSTLAAVLSMTPLRQITDHLGQIT